MPRTPKRPEDYAYPYYKIAFWSEALQTWCDTRATYKTAAAAKGNTVNPGRYRVSRVTVDGRLDMEPFEVNE